MGRIAAGHDARGLHISWLGFGLYWASIYVGFQSTALFSGMPTSLAAINTFFLSSLVTSVIVHLVLALLFARFPDVAKASPPIAAASLLALGFCGLGLCWQLGDAAWTCLFASGIVCGVGNAWIDVLWLEFYGSIRPQASGAYIPASFLVAIAGYFLIVAIARLAPIAGLVATLACVTAAGVSLDAARRVVEDDGGASLASNMQGLAGNEAETPVLGLEHDMRTQPTAPAQLARQIWKPLILACACSLVYALLDRVTSIDNGYFDLVHAIALASCAAGVVVLLTATRMGGRSYDISSVCKLVIPLFVVGCLLVPALGGFHGLWPTVLVAVGYTVFDVLIYALIAELAYDYAVSGAVVAGIARATIIGASGVGGVIGYGLARTSLSVVTLVVVSLALVYLIALGASGSLSFPGRARQLDVEDAMNEDGGDDQRPAATTINSEVVSEDVNDEHAPAVPGLPSVEVSPAGASQTGASASEAPASEARTGAGLPDTGKRTATAEQSAAAQLPTTRSTAAAQAQATDASLEALDLKVMLATRQYGLTRREAEVLAYLVRGRNLAYVAEDLVLSEHTVRTHIRHIYEKAGVHDRQELISTIESL